MRLLDVANLNPPAGSAGGPADGRWKQGFNRSNRSCSVQIETTDPCLSGEAPGAIIGDVTTRKGNYSVYPFSIGAALRQSVSCEEADDKDWFRQAVAAKMEYLAGRALVTQMHPLVDTWIGNADVQEANLAGSTAANWQDAINEAYDLWQTTVVDTISEPLLHIPPKFLPQLQAAGIITVTGPTEISSGYSPKVVVSPGYNANPTVFFSSEIVIYCDGLDDQGGPIYNTRINEYSIQGNEQMAIDITPCSTVRLGDA